MRDRTCVEPVEDDPCDRPAERFVHLPGPGEGAKPEWAEGAIEDLVVGDVRGQLARLARGGHALGIAAADRRERLLLPKRTGSVIVLGVGEQGRKRRAGLWRGE